MIISHIPNKRCRKCGNSNLNIFEDGSGYCPECNDSFMNINDIETPDAHWAKRPINNVGENKITSNKEKGSSIRQYENYLIYLYFIFGLGFIGISIWNVMLFAGDGIFTLFILTDFLCGCLSLLSGMSIESGNYKRALYVSIGIFFLFLFQELYYIFIDGVVFDIFYVCPVSYLLFIVISIFILLKLNTGVKE